MKPNHTSKPAQSTGFTLVEMLVAVALVLLIMTLFTQIFQIAGSSLNTQRGIAENDQRARLLSSLLRSDLDKRTMRIVQPFGANEDLRLSSARPDQRRGYFSYVENDPADPTDDSLQLTCLVNLQNQNVDTSPFTGGANVLISGGRNITNVTTSSPVSFSVNGDVTAFARTGDSIWIRGSTANGLSNDGKYLVASSNFTSGTTQIIVSAPNLPSSVVQGKVVFASEPEFDDGDPNNAAGASAAAEVVYFLRAGILYRRVLLIREARTVDEAQPRYTNGSRVIVTGNTVTANGEYPLNGANNTSFWRDFDYSAFFYSGKTTSSGTRGAGVLFHGTGPSLNNGEDGEFVVLDDTVSPISTRPVSLGIPHWRFGHNPSTGRPREYLNVGPDNVFGTADDTVYFGRFLTQETASINFGYPGYIPTGANPFSRTDLTATAGRTDLIDQFEDSPPVRRGDDILLTNVLAFDIKVRDPQTGAFVDLGDDTNTSNNQFKNSGILNTAYSPATRCRFDTWHPQASVGGNTSPPFRPKDASGNFVPLQAIQIQVLYQDQVGGRTRTMTLTQSLVDSP